MKIHRLFPLAAAAVASACGTAGAVTQIEGTLWSAYSDAISNQGSMHHVHFVARSTAIDVASGVTFSIQERDPDGNDTIFDLALPWEAPHPAVGTEIRVFVSFYLRCDDGSLAASRLESWYLTWCDPTLGTQMRWGRTGVVSTGTSEPESFELVLADEAGIEAPGATVEDAYYCGENAVTKQEPLFRSPYELIRDGLPITTESGPLPRIDPRIELEYTGSIRIAFDPAGVQTCGEIPEGTASTLYVVAQAAGPTLCGITGAELRVLGIPEGWYATAAIPPGSIGLGSPLDAHGGNMAYYECQLPAEPVLLYTITVVATTAVTDHVVEVTARTPPLNPDWNCPLVTLCDLPNYTKVCMSGSRLRINPPPGTVCQDGLVGVEPSTWSAVKRLFR